MKLPVLVSLPHAGLDVPEELRAYCILSHEEIVRDGDEEAWEIYHELEGMAEAFHTTGIARAFVDMNRAADDIRLDGVVKTHTTWNEPVYDRELPADLIKTLIEKYWKPYHESLSKLSQKRVKLGLDCHTMASIGPPVGPDTGEKRPAVCLSNAEGTCPEEWIRGMAEKLEEAFKHEVRINHPFKGGYIIRSHAPELPWMQVELSRGGEMTPSDKRRCFYSALNGFARQYLDFVS